MVERSRFANPVNANVCEEMIVGTQRADVPNSMHERVHEQHQEGTTTSYEPYIHVPTGYRALIPVRIDPEMGARVEIVPPPSDFVHAPVDNPRAGHDNLFAVIRRCNNPSVRT